MRALLIIIVIIVILAGIWFIFAYNYGGETVVEDDGIETMNDLEEDNRTPGTTTEQQGTTSDMAAPRSGVDAIVTYSEGGFSPQSVTIQQGETVGFQSERGEMWVASDEHPTHANYSGTTRNEHCAAEGSTGAFDQCNPAESYSFMFDKPGTWSYHNHLRPQDTGTIIVE